MIGARVPSADVPRQLGVSGVCLFIQCRVFVELPIPRTHLNLCSPRPTEHIAGSANPGRSPSTERDPSQGCSKSAGAARVGRTFFESRGSTPIEEERSKGTGGLDWMGEGRERGWWCISRWLLAARSPRNEWDETDGKVEEEARKR